MALHSFERAVSLSPADLPAKHAYRVNLDGAKTHAAALHRLKLANIEAAVASGVETNARARRLRRFALHRLPQLVCGRCRILLGQCRCILHTRHSRGRGRRTRLPADHHLLR